MGARLTDSQLAALEHLERLIPPAPWHAGRTTGRQLYKGDGPDDGIGFMDNRALGEYVAAARNALPALVAEVRASRSVEWAGPKCAECGRPVGPLGGYWCEDCWHTRRERPWWRLW